MANYVSRSAPAVDLTPTLQVVDVPPDLRVDEDVVDVFHILGYVEVSHAAPGLKLAPHHVEYVAVVPFFQGVDRACAIHVGDSRDEPSRQRMRGIVGYVAALRIFPGAAKIADHAVCGDRRIEKFERDIVESNGVRVKPDHHVLGGVQHRMLHDEDLEAELSGVPDQTGVIGCVVPAVTNPFAPSEVEPGRIVLESDQVCAEFRDASHDDALVRDRLLEVYVEVEPDVFGKMFQKAVHHLGAVLVPPLLGTGRHHAEGLGNRFRHDLPRLRLERDVFPMARGPAQLPTSAMPSRCRGFRAPESTARTQQIKRPGRHITCSWRSDIFPLFPIQEQSPRLAILDFLE